MEEVLRKINQAFADCDIQVLTDNVTEDICWIIVGERTISGKPAFSEALQKMGNRNEMEIEVVKVMEAGKIGIVEGTIHSRNKNGQSKDFGFCEIYLFDDNSLSKIKKITSYIIDVSRHKRYRESC